MDRDSNRLEYYVKLWSPLVLLAFLVTVFLLDKGRMPVILVLQWMAFVLLITLFTRSVSGLHLGACFGFGLGWAPLLSVFLIRTPSRQQVDWLIPFVEEFLKISPLLILLFWPRSRLRRSGGLSDFIVLGGAFGAAFTLMEDLLLGWSAEKWRALLYGPHLGFFYLFPNTTIQNWSVGSSFPVLFLGHGTGTVLLSLSLGIATYLWADGKRILSVVLPLIVYILISLMHAFFNAASGVRLQDFPPYSIFSWA